MPIPSCYSFDLKICFIHGVDGHSDSLDDTYGDTITGVMPKYGSDWRAFPTAVRQFLVPNSASTSTVDLGFGDGAGLGPRRASFPSFQISMPVEDFMSRFNNATLTYGGGRRW